MNTSHRICCTHNAFGLIQRHTRTVYVRIQSIPFLRQSRDFLFDGFPVTLLSRCQALVQFGDTGFDLPQSLIPTHNVLGFSDLVLYFIIGRFDGRGRFVQRLLRGRKLRFCLLLFLGQLLPGLFNLPPGYLNGRLAIVDLVSGIDQLFPVIFQLLFAVCQFFQRVAQLLLRFGFGVLILPDAVQILLIALVVLVFRFLLHIEEPLLTQTLRLGLEPVRFRVEKIVVFIAINRVTAAQPQVHLRVVIIIQRGLRYIEIIR